MDRPGRELPEDAVDRDHFAHQHQHLLVYAHGASAAHVLCDSMRAHEWAEPGPAPPGFAVFAVDTITRRLMDADNQIEHWSEFDRGGHFPAMEVQELVAGDLRTFFRRLRLGEPAPVDLVAGAICEEGLGSVDSRQGIDLDRVLMTMR